MSRKLLKISLLAIATLLLVACGQKQNSKQPEFINSLVLVDAVASEGNYLPLEMFVENGELYVRYIKNGKPLDKIKLAYSHFEKSEYDTLCYFDEIINGEKGGQYYFSDLVYYMGSAFCGDECINYINKKNDTIFYWVSRSIKKSDLQISVSNLSEKTERELLKIRNEEIPENKIHRDAYYDSDYIKNLYYLLKNNPTTIDYPFNILKEQDDFYTETSSDGNFRIYCQYYYLPGSIFPFIMAQYKSGNNVNLFEFDYWSTDKYETDFPYVNGIKIHTLNLNNKAYYLVDCAIVDRASMNHNVANGNQIRIYSIENGELKKQKLFNTTKKTLDEIAFMYDGSQFYDEDSTSDFDFNIVKYNNKNKTILVPLINKTALTNRYLQYKWDGKYFTYIGVK
jgi:hypothetical protein